MSPDVAAGGSSPLAVLGTWRLDRTITDRFADETLAVTGVLVVTQEHEDRLRWREDGTLVRAGRQVPVWREHLLVWRDDGWMLTFDDGRDVHPWSPDETVVHPCAADTYRGTYDLGVTGQKVGAWSLTWREPPG